MPRKKRASLKRVVEPDLKFKDTLVALLVNRLLWQGKKGVAQSIIYKAFDQIQEKKQGNPLEFFKKALDNIKPSMEVRSRRVGGANYQVPIEVRSDRKFALAMKWLIEAARGRGEHSMSQRLAGEILDALENRGSAIKKKEETHKMAEANRAFAHYKW